MAWSETITGLQQGTIDGLDIPVSVTYSNGFPDIAKYLNMTGHFYSPLFDLCVGWGVRRSESGGTADFVGRRRGGQERPAVRIMPVLKSRC